jgi:hypothetical protein
MPGMQKTGVWMSLAVIVSLAAPGCGRRNPPAFAIPANEMNATGYRVRWENAEIPPNVARAGRVYGRVRFVNAGTEIWHGWIHCAYYFVRADASPERGREAATRLAFQRPVAPGQEVVLERFAISTPTQPGDYFLVFDLINEFVAWFSDRGAERLRVAVRVE